MHEPSIPKLIAKRLADDWTLLLSVFIGFSIATTLGAASPVYFDSLEQLAFNTALDRLPTGTLNINFFAPKLPLADGSLRRAEQSLADAIDRHIPQIYLARHTYLRGGNYLVGLPTRRLPEVGETGTMVSRGYFQHLSDLELHSRFLQGRMAGKEVTGGSQGPVLEAVIVSSATRNFSLEVGDVVTLTPDIGFSSRLTARIVGVFEPDDLTQRYWNYAGILLDPTPLTQAPPQGVRVDPDEPPVSLFVTQEAMVEAVGQAYPDSLVSPIWFVQVDKGRLKAWSIQETRSRLDDFESEIIGAMPGSSVGTGIVRGMIDDIERRSFFSRVPLLLLLAVMAVTVLFFLSMMVSYLVQSRERDAALLRTRGVGTLRLLRLYALEGLIMAALAVALAPFLALGLVALAGKLPYFRDMTGGDLLPVEMGPAPFLAAAGAGLLCLAIFVLPGALSARGGLLALKLRSARPPTVSFFHRYYLDVALLSLGGLTFWELHSRGQLVSGGLFKGVEVNETLLVTPVLLLIVVVLVFMRLFPLVVRFVSGESPALLHLLTAATLLSLATGTAIRETVEGDGLVWTGAVALLVAVGAAYRATGRAGNPRLRLAGLVLQAGLVGGFVALEPPVAGQVLFAPTVGLICVVPAQVAFLLLKASARAAPVWLSMGLWHMARNPLQYTWLILLLVLATGLGILSTTVGGTLDRSQTDRIMYEVGTDIRVSGISEFLDGGARGLKETYVGTPGIAAASLALRTAGSVGPSNVQVLGLESREFPHISWYRKDFSDRPLSDVMEALQPVTEVNRVAIPEGASAVGVWARPEEVYANMSIWIVIEDDRGDMTTVSLGRLGPPEWRLMSAPIPARLKSPRYLVSVQIFEPGEGSAGTYGTLLLDDIHVTVGPDAKEFVLEDFESEMRWTPIATSLISSDSISSTAQDSYRGQNAGIFSFGRGTNRSVRGFYQSTSGGPLPIVVSSSVATATGHDVGDRFIANITGRLTPVMIRDTVDYFPTMNHEGGGFILADLDHLLRYLNMFGHPSRVGPNELFLKGAPGADQTVEGVVDELATLLVDLEDRASRLESVRLDPLASAGWRATVLFALGIVLLAGAFGYSAYLLLFANQSRSEVGFLESMGLSRGQLMGLLGFEHIAVAGIGLGLGTWAGFRMSSLMVSSLAVTESGEQVVPPFIVMTDWSLMLPTYTALIVVFLAALFVLNRSIGRLDLHTIARVGEY